MLVGVAEPLPKRLRRLRESRGLSQEELGRAAGVHRTYISHIERGMRPNPTLDILVLIARGLEMPLGDLVEGVAIEAASKGGSSAAAA
jgi:transcriptional regulator with XRE-family HTH domain